MSDPLTEALRGGPAWIVGGTVRDELLGRPVTDVDVAVAGGAEEAARAVARSLGGPVFPLSERFGAWRAIDRASGRTYDVSELQGETIEDDLSRRDFTVNAMARPLEGGEVTDPHGGRRRPRRQDAAPGVARGLRGGPAEAASPGPPRRGAGLRARPGHRAPHARGRARA